MTETLVVYALVAACAAWVVWRLVLPARVKQGLRARFGKQKPKGGCDTCGR
jgi:choline-glycine betaine transporter